ncbi:hypothetical protein BV210_01575 [Halorientalis sp. IM1011]|uniref:DUF58 domain-containing protein n=1 Tax=Halorientalis sp. IM1011 TaxID=1932360 RepID=UPI00097CC940|nr:DUF58 domain-containing protein [Halorientalis sp. IM1011]AQL41482.1 hypothetical protein BV210_01575 [Halorientalis sp. IM1011]
MTRTRRTHHWRGVVAVALLAAALGVLFKRPLIVLAAAVGVGFAVYPHLRTPPDVSLAVDRRLGERDPSPGESVTVTVTVTNVGESWLPDLRLIDGVPAMLTVVDGTARHAATLRPGESTTFSYTVAAEHGAHRFRPLTAIARDVSGEHEVELEVEAVDEIECLRAPSEPPVAGATDPYPGQVLTDASGAGIEFDHTREYRPGDARSRIDWRQLAKTGSLTTLEFRQERSVAVTVCVDARPVAYRGRPGEPHAISHSVAAARELLEAIWALDERGGLTTLGGSDCWLPPGRGSAHADRARQLLLSHPSLSPQPPEDPSPDGSDGADDSDDQFDRLRTRLDRDAQLFLLTPLADDAVVAFALELAATGRSVTVVSPDVTGEDSPGERLATVERRNRIDRLRRGDVRVVDWDPTNRLRKSVATARKRWQR